MAADYEGVAVTGEQELGQRHWGEWGELGLGWSGVGWG